MLILMAKVGQFTGDYLARRHHEQNVAKARAAAPAPEGWVHSSGPDGGVMRQKEE